MITQRGKTEKRAVVIGLDMYLYRREYVGGWDWKKKDKETRRERAMYDNIVDYIGVTSGKNSPHAYIDLCVAYWRKAHAIHKWFCSLDGGRDDCQDIYVSYDRLRELRDLCVSVIENPDLAESILPVQEDFFFGSYDYIEDLKYTVKQLDVVLNDIDSDTFANLIYRASW